MRSHSTQALETVKNHDGSVKTISELNIEYYYDYLIYEDKISTVYRGNMGGNLVAVRFLHAKNIEDIEQAKNEINIMRQLNDEMAPNIIHCHASGLDEPSNRFYVVTEYSYHSPFPEYTERVDRSLDGVLSIVYQCAVAIEYLHSWGLLHNGLNTENVYLFGDDARPDAKLANFGRASKVTEVTRMKVNQDKPNWCAPELFRGARYTKETDMYGYSMLANQVARWTRNSPYHNHTRDVTIASLRKLHDQKTNQCREMLVYDCPDALLEVINRGWKINPNERMTAAEVKQVLAKEMQTPIKKFRYGAKIGGGAYGDVYSGKYGDDTVAAKLMKWSNRPSKDNYVGYEIDLVKNLTQHQAPNIVKYIGCEIDLAMKEDLLIMEYCELGSLSNYIVTHINDRDVNLSLSLAYDCVVAIDYLHSNALLHNDIKRANVLLTKKENQIIAKMADFGLACSVNYAMKNKTVRCTRQWGAPELFIRGGYNSYESDMYSLAMLMYVLIRWDGKKPLEDIFKSYDSSTLGNTEQDVLEHQHMARLHLNQQNQNLPLPLDCPEALKEVIHGGWKIKLAERIQVSQVKATLFKALNPPSSDISVTSTPLTLKPLS